MKTIIKVLINSFTMAIVTAVICFALILSLIIGACCFNPDVIDFVLNPDGFSDYLEINYISTFFCAGTFLIGLPNVFFDLGKFNYKRFKKNVDLIKEDEKNEKQ